MRRSISSGVKEKWSSLGGPSGEGFQPAVAGGARIALADAAAR